MVLSHHNSQVRWSEPTRVGLHEHFEVEWVGPKKETKATARALFESVLQRYPATTFTVDLRADALANAELFGRSDHRAYAPDGYFDELRKLALKLAVTTDREELIREVIEDTGWFSLGAYGVLLDRHSLIDRFRDGIHLELYTRS